MNKLAAIDIGKTFLGPSYGGSGGSIDAFQNLGGISQLVSLFLNISFVLAGLILLFFFILGGIGMIGSAGGSDPQKSEQAKKTLTSAVMGFIIVFASYWIVKLVEMMTGIKILE